MIPYDQLLQVRSEPREFSWSERDVMLYALGVGLGRDPLDARELPFVYENGLRVLPSFATVAAWGSNPPYGPMGVNYLKVLHGEQGITIHRPLPATGRIIAGGRVVGAVDKGPKGALILMETILQDQASGEALATLNATIFARDDGGFGGPTEGAPEPHQPPARKPDVTVEFETRPDQALLYRLAGDRNPLHADPAVAQAAGFDRPILHGLCTYGITCRAVVQSFADYQPERIASHRLRFAAPVFPGETIAVDLWRDADIVSFEARAKERGVAIIKNGKAVLR